MDSCNFTNKANLHTPKVEIHTRQKIMPFRSLFCGSEVILSKTFRLGYPGWIVHIGTFSSLSPSRKTEISVTGQPGFSSEHKKFLRRREWEVRSRKPSKPGGPRSFHEDVIDVYLYAALNKTSCC